MINKAEQHDNENFASRMPVEIPVEMAVEILVEMAALHTDCRQHQTKLF